jgi:excinuclease UvrABC helicase subunit UvrB
MYADKMTRSMNEAIEETNRRRAIQEAYNQKNNITPKSTKRELATIADDVRDKVEEDEGWGKAGAMLTPQGFTKLEQGPENVENGEFEIKIESRFATGKKRAPVGRPIPGQGDSNSSNRAGRKAVQIYQAFDESKESYIKEFAAQNLSDGELKERLQIAIDSYNFEEAAALRDLLNARQSP